MLRGTRSNSSVSAYADTHCVCTPNKPRHDKLGSRAAQQCLPFEYISLFWNRGGFHGSCIACLHSIDESSSTSKVYGCSMLLVGDRLPAGLPVQIFVYTNRKVKARISTLS